jgi:hypothetical protein
VPDYSPPTTPEHHRRVNTVNTATTLRDRANLAVITAQTRMVALTEDPERGGAPDSGGREVLGLGAVAVLAVGVLILTKMGAAGVL